MKEYLEPRCIVSMCLPSEGLLAASNEDYPVDPTPFSSPMWIDGLID